MFLRYNPFGHRMHAESFGHAKNAKLMQLVRGLQYLRRGVHGHTFCDLKLQAVRGQPGADKRLMNHGAEVGLTEKGAQMLTATATSSMPALMSVALSWQAW